jgi:hypothetical protein
MLRILLGAMPIFLLNFSLLSLQSPERKTTSAKDSSPQVEGKGSANIPPRREIEDKMNRSKYTSPDRKRAISLLESLLNRVKDIESEEFKIRAQIQIGDAIWDYNEPRARAQLTDAFHNITSMKSQTNQEQHGRDPKDKDAIFESPRFRLQQEALRVIAKRDFDLAETLRKSISANAEGKELGESAQGGSEEQKLLSTSLALSLAKTDPLRTSQIVRDNLGVWGFEDSTWLLAGIRRENPDLADSLFGEALSAVRNQPAPIFNNIGFLANYIYPDEEEIFFDRDPMANPARRAMIEHFLNFVSDVISQTAPAEQPSSITDKQITARAARQEYATLRKLMSVFDKLPPDKTSTIRGRIGQLAKDIPVSQLNRVEGGLRQMSAQVSAQELLKRAEASGNARQKNMNYHRAAMTAFRQGDINQALSIADKLSSWEDRISLRSMIRRRAALKALDKKDVDTAYDFAKDIDVMQHRVDIYRGLAQRLFGNKNDARAENILREIEQWIENAGTGLDKVAALLNIADIVAKHDPTRFLGLMKSVCAAINGADVANPGTRAVSSERVVMMIPVTMESLDLKSPFSLLASLDFDQALQLAQSIEKNEASIMAQVAICQEILKSSLTDQPSNNKKDSHKAPDELQQGEQEKKVNKKKT